jgi:hypothetical protein
MKARSSTLIRTINVLGVGLDGTALRHAGLLMTSATMAKTAA